MPSRLSFVAFVVFTLGLAAAPAADRPNFIVFLTDDLGWGDLACYGHEKIQTPHLDQFASEGMRFTQAYSACGVCSPSRASVLTGRTPYRNGVWRWLPVGNQAHLRESEITIPELLKTVGYQTMHSGKWHLNGYFNSPDQPQARVTIDLDHSKLILEIGETRIEHQLPASLESVTHVGIYAKGTSSEFSAIERVE